MSWVGPKGKEGPRGQPEGTMAFDVSWRGAILEAVTCPFCGTPRRTSLDTDFMVEIVCWGCGVLWGRNGRLMTTSDEGRTWNDAPDGTLVVRRMP